MEEIWRPIVGYETVYEVSSLGNIRRIAVITKLSAANLKMIQQARANGESFRRIAQRFSVTQRAIISALTYPSKFSFRTPYRRLKPQKTPQGYLAVQLCKDGKPHLYRVHTLVARAFIGVIPPKWCVNHLNGIRTDNRRENLEIVTLGDNTRHAFHVLKIPGHGQKGSTNANAKLHESAIPIIRSMCTQGLPYTVIATYFHVSPTLIQRINQGKAWRHVPL